MRRRIFRGIVLTTALLTAIVVPEGVNSMGEASAITTTQIVKPKPQVPANDAEYNSVDLFLQYQKEHIRKTWKPIIPKNDAKRVVKKKQKHTIPSGKESVSKSIRLASKKFNVPFDLLYAQAYTESSLNPNATGSLGDIGLFQILPSTAESLNKMHFHISGFTPSMLYNPTLNAEFAGYYLRYLYSFTNNWTATLTAYNIGLAGLYNQHSNDSPYYERVKASHEKLFGSPL